MYFTVCAAFSPYFFYVSCYFAIGYVALVLRRIVYYIIFTSFRQAFYARHKNLCAERKKTCFSVGKTQKKCLKISLFYVRVAEKLAVIYTLFPAKYPVEKAICRL